MKMKNLLTLIVLSALFSVFSCKSGNVENSGSDSAVLENDSVSEEEEFSGGFIGIKTRSMEKKEAMNFSGDPDYDFASVMQLHHKYGMAIVNEEIKYGADTTLKKLAESIKAEQENDLKDFQNYLNNNQPGLKNEAFINEIKSSIQKAKEETEKSSGMSGNFDRDFATLMAMHHRQGLELVKLQIKYGKNPEMKKLAQKISKQQEGERKQLEKYK